MIGYAFLGVVAGFAAGVFMTMDIIKQELKAGVVVMGRRVYRVVHSTEVRERK